MKKPARRPVFFLQPPKRFQVRKNAITWQPEPEQQPGRPEQPGRRQGQPERPEQQRPEPEQQPGRPEQQPELLFCHRR